MIVPPEHVGHDWQLDPDQAWLLKRIARALLVLKNYTAGTSWVVNDLYPIQRIGHAQRLLTKYFLHGPDDLEAQSLADHPFVRSRLKTQIENLEVMALGHDRQAAWAAQILHDLRAALALTDGVNSTHFL